MTSHGVDKQPEEPLGPSGLPEGVTHRGYGTCRSCGAEVLWGRYEATRRMAPFDPDGTNHFATCPQADDWRRK